MSPPGLYITHSALCMDGVIYRLCGAEVSPQIGYKPGECFWKGVSAVTHVPVSRLKSVTRDVLQGLFDTSTTDSIKYTKEEVSARRRHRR